MFNTAKLKTILCKSCLLPIFLFYSSIGAQAIKLNEFVQSNTAGVVDEDNEYSPWLEIYNNSGSSKNISGYGLTTDTSNPFRYTFPTCPLKTDQYMVIYISGKQGRTSPFKWSTIIDKGDVWKYFVGHSEPPADWNEVYFNDNSWSEGQSGFGYGDNDDATVLPNTNSVYVRKSFDVEDVNNIEILVLNVDYDDAFIAFINGHEIARANIGEPGDPVTFNQNADNSSHEAAIYKGNKPESFYLKDFSEYLVKGENLLALQVHNAGSSSTDLTLIPFLTALFKDEPSADYPLSEYLPDLPVGIHVDFIPDADTEKLYLMDQSGNVVDELAIDGIPANSSIGRSAYEDSDVLIFDTPTPGAANLTDGIPYFPFGSSHLPIISINTDGKSIRDTIKIDAEMGIIDNDGTNYITDQFNDFNGVIGIELRGSTSLGFPKKQYSVETRDSTGDDLNVSLMGFPEESDWVVHAPYSDKSLIRNVLEYTLSRKMGRYATRTRFCELLLNGQYQGLYVLMEKIKRDKGRVDIAKLNEDEVSGEDLTGGYIIKLDKQTGEGNDGWYSNIKSYNGRKVDLFYQYHYPKPVEIAEEQKEYIQNYMADFEAVLAGFNFKDPINGYRKYIDVDSFIDHLILTEISKNVDGYRLSTFMYKDKNGLLNMGPLWDYNLAFGNANYDDASDVEGWQIDWLGGYQYSSIPFWWRRLLEDEYFRNKFKTRWTELRESVLSNVSVNGAIDSLVNLLGDASTRNFTRWPILDEYVWPNVIWGTTYEGEISYLKNWIRRRLQWLDDNMPGQVVGIHKNDPMPNKIVIHQNQPNPFNATTRISFYITEQDIITLEVFNAIGQKVSSLLNSVELGQGEYSYSFDGSNFASGIYYYRFISSGKTLTKKMILLK